MEPDELPSPPELNKVGTNSNASKTPIAKPLPELHGKQQRVAKSPLMHRDSRLSMGRSSKSLKVHATCPYCEGGGCKKCTFKGLI